RARHADAEVPGRRGADVLGGVVGDAAVGQERPDHVRRLVGRAVIDHEDLEVAERLAQHRRQGVADETVVIVGGDDDKGSRGHGTRTSEGRRNGFATREMQKRYFPDGSWGMRSTYSHSYTVSGPKRSATSARRRRRVAGPKSRPSTRRKRNRRTVSWMIW